MRKPLNVPRALRCAVAAGVMVFLAAALVSCTRPLNSAGPPSKEASEMTTDSNTAGLPSSTQAAESAGRQEQLQVATFGAGCFWCVEAVFEQLDGVDSVESGYSGGQVVNPTYEQVCSGTTGHAEVCRIRFDPAKISYDDLLQVFWQTHDPTTLNRQGADVGTQYRSVVFYHDEAQKEIVQQRKRQLEEAGLWRDPIVTEISPAPKFYKAEAYHQGYYRNNPEGGYCQVVIAPKLEKFRKVFRQKLRPSAGGHASQSAAPQ